MKTKTLIIVLFQLIVWPLFARAPFQNLNFEQANIPAGTQQGASVDNTTALPDWSVSTQLYYDTASLGGALISINDTNTSFFNFIPLQGHYSVLLFAGPDGSTSILQTGLVPGYAKSLEIDIESPVADAFTGPIDIALGGQQIALIPLQTFANYTVYGGDISAFAGLTETLSITQTHLPGPPPSGSAFDDIVFSPSPVPEPATWAIFASGLAVFFLRKQRGQTKKNG